MVQGRSKRTYATKKMVRVVLNELPVRLRSSARP